MTAALTSDRTPSEDPQNPAPAHAGTSLPSPDLQISGPSVERPDYAGDKIRRDSQFSVSLQHEIDNNPLVRIFSSHDSRGIQEIVLIHNRMGDVERFHIRTLCEEFDHVCVITGRQRIEWLPFLPKQLYFDLQPINTISSVIAELQRGNDPLKTSVVTREQDLWLRARGIDRAINTGKLGIFVGAVSPPNRYQLLWLSLFGWRL